VQLVTAGHPPPLLRRGGNVAPVGATGTLLGVYPDITLTEVTVELDRGDMLVLYTDGVTEARGVDGFYGTERLAAAVGAPRDATADTVAEALLTDVVAFQRGKLRDDVAILVIEAADVEAAR
jgi:sigma-B regulation protein RsbU (phosphoserine phosphatase)